MTIDVVTPKTSAAPKSRVLPWWVYAALAGLGLVTTLFVIIEALNASVGQAFWFVMAILATNWVFFGTTFYFARDKPRRRK